MNYLKICALYIILVVNLGCDMQQRAQAGLEPQAAAARAKPARSPFLCILVLLQESSQKAN